jgi:hypothetical protein
MVIKLYKVSKIQWSFTIDLVWINPDHTRKKEKKNLNTVPKEKENMQKEYNTSISILYGKYTSISYTPSQRIK